MNVEATEKLVQLSIGVLCALALIYFLYIELMNPDIVMSDRAFWALVSLAASALALKDLQALLGRTETGSDWGSSDRGESRRRGQGRQDDGRRGRNNRQRNWDRGEDRYDQEDG